MTRRLDVYLYDKLTGQLVQDDSGKLQFKYDSAWLTDKTSLALSQSLPLQVAPFEEHACRPFFAGVLPESELRERIAKNLGITARNDFALLDRIGGECAGAVTFKSAGSPSPLPPKSSDYKVLSETELADSIRLLPQRPLMAGQQGIRLSLAGAQNKLPVFVSNDEIALPLNDTPSTHIIKPPIPYYESTVHNEAFCMLLAKKMGLHISNVEIRFAQGKPFLLAQRYDRKQDKPGIERLHQEDFCQALGIVPELKYQNEGGPSLAQCFSLLKNCSSTPAIDIPRLLAGILFNYFISNCDAHGKNFSLLYDGRRKALAPFYDLMCTKVYPELSETMAMKISGKYAPDKIMPRHWERFAKEAGLAAPLVLKEFKQMAENIVPASLAVAKSMENQGITAPLVKQITNTIEAGVAKVKPMFF